MSTNISSSKDKPCTDEVEQEFSKLRIPDPKPSPTFTGTESNAEGEEEDKRKADLPERDDSITVEIAQQFKSEGNTLYAKGEYELALKKYTIALSSPFTSSSERSIYLGNRGAVNLKLQRFEQVIKDCSEALRLQPAYKKALLRRKEAYECTYDFDSAARDAKSLGLSKSEIERLRLKGIEKKKKDTDQALNSLKGLGNSILSNFGMSLDDFKVEQNPDNNGSYSVKMNN